MLNATETALLLRCAALATGKGDAALAAEINDALLASAQHRASVASSTRAARGKGSRGAPTRAFVIDLEPGPRLLAQGAKAASAVLAEQVTKLGAKRTLPTAGSLAVMVSRDGHWTTLLETDNGTVSVTVQYAEPDGTTPA